MSTSMREALERAREYIESDARNKQYPKAIELTALIDAALSSPGTEELTANISEQAKRVGATFVPSAEKIATYEAAQAARQPEVDRDAIQRKVAEWGARCFGDDHMRDKPQTAPDGYRTIPISLLSALIADAECLCDHSRLTNDGVKSCRNDIAMAKAYLGGSTPLAAPADTGGSQTAPDDEATKYDDPRFNEGVLHVVDLLAKTIGSTDWVAGDGSEDYDEDLATTLLNILAAKGLYDRDEGMFATLPAAPADAERLALADHLTPAWCGAMVAALATRSNGYPRNGITQHDVDVGRKLADAMPSILTIIRAGGWREDVVARSADEYHEDMGDVLWWKFPITEAPYVGSPLDLGQTVEVTVKAFGVDKVMRVNVGGWPDYHTHFTPIPLPSAPKNTDKND